MPSVKNPNVPQKARRLATRGKVQKRKANGAAFTSDKNPSTSNPRNPRANTLAPGATLYPTSGPLAPLSKKKAKKVERAQRLARQRMVEKLKKEGGEVDMTDAPKQTKSKNGDEVEAAASEGMDVDMAS